MGSHGPACHNFASEHVCGLQIADMLFDKAAAGNRLLALYRGSIDSLCRTGGTGTVVNVAGLSCRVLADDLIAHSPLCPIANPSA